MTMIVGGCVFEKARRKVREAETLLAHLDAEDLTARPRGRLLERVTQVRRLVATPQAMLRR